MSTPKRKRCKYPHFVAVRVDDDLYEKINNDAITAGISPSEYIRQILKKGYVNVKHEVVADIPLLKKMVADFGKVGSNINQIAHYFNAGGTLNSEIEAQLRESLTQLYNFKFEIEKYGGEFRAYSQAYCGQKQ